MFTTTRQFIEDRPSVRTALLRWINSASLDAHSNQMYDDEQPASDDVGVHGHDARRVGVKHRTNAISYVTFQVVVGLVCVMFIGNITVNFIRYHFLVQYPARLITFPVSPFDKQCMSKIDDLVDQSEYDLLCTSAQSAISECNIHYLVVTERWSYKKEFLNAEIVDVGDTGYTPYEEPVPLGCPNFGDTLLRNRRNTISVSGQDRHNKTISKRFSGATAACIAHHVELMIGKLRCYSD